SRASFHSLYNSTSFSPPISYFSFQLYGYHRDLHSFPTRRSSDLCPPPRCSRATPTPPTPTSTPRWRATSAAAAPTNGSAPRSSRRPRVLRSVGRGPDHDHRLSTGVRDGPGGGRRGVAAGLPSRRGTARGADGRDLTGLCAQRLHPHRARRRHHAHHAAGRNGTGHVHVDAHAAGGRARGRTGPDSARARPTR